MTHITLPNKNLQHYLLNLIMHTYVNDVLQTTPAFPHQYAYCFLLIFFYQLVMLFQLIHFVIDCMTNASNQLISYNPELSMVS